MTATRAGRRIAGVVLTAMLIVALTATLAAPAEAWTVNRKRSKPGRVFPQPVTVTDYTTLWGTVHTLSTQGVRARRTPRSRIAQDVNLLYVVQRWDGTRWRRVTQAKVWNRIKRGRKAVRLPSLWIQPNAPVGYYRVVLRFTWFKARTNRLLASSRAVPNQAGDFICGTNQRLCRTGPGWVRIGRHRMLGGGW